jgi:transcriptional regulator of met regulon
LKKGNANRIPESVRKLMEEMGIDATLDELTDEQTDD